MSALAEIAAEQKARAQIPAQCGKAAAVRAYCLGWLSLASCQQMFRRNPSWRAA